MSRASVVLMDLRESKCISRTEICLYLAQTTPDETKWSPEVLRRLEEGRLPLKLSPHVRELQAVKQHDSPVFTAEEITSLTQAVEADGREAIGHAHG